MNNPSKKNMKWLLAAIGSVGIYHANANAIEINDPDQKVAVIRCLVSQGLIVPLNQPNWYQINRERLEMTLNGVEKNERKAVRIVEMLKATIGSDVHIKNVDFFEARLGTQDYAASIAQPGLECE